MADSTAPLYQRAKTTANGQKIVLTYSEALSSTTAAKEAFVVKVEGQALAVRNVAIVGNEVELSLVAAVQRGQRVTVSYTDDATVNQINAVQDVAGNDAARLTNRTVTNLSTVEITAPALVTNNAPLDIAADIQLTFAEPVTKGAAGGIYIYKADGTLVERFDIATSERVIVSGNTLTINPTWMLEGSANFYVQMDAGALNVGGDAYAGIRNRSLTFQSGTETRNAMGAASMNDHFPGTASEAIGEHRALYIRVNYADEVVTPTTEERVRADMADFERFYAESSFGRISVSTTMTPVVTIPQTLNWLNDFDRAENGLGVLHASARQEALKLGFDPSQYDVVIVRVDAGLRSGSSWGGGDSVWISWDGASVIAHEAGHALGRGHSNFLEYDGSVEEYGNAYDNMGGGDPFAAHFNTIHKTALQWIQNNELHINPENGLYRIYAYDAPNTQVGRQYGIQIDSSSGKYWLEYHPQVGGRFENAAIVLRSYDAVTQSDQNVLIDTTPSAENIKSDAGIDVGRTYKIDDTYVTVVARGEGYLDVNIQKGTFANNTAPTAEFTASASQVREGEQVTFNAKAADANGDALAYFWAFSDGVVGSGARFSRFFSQSSATNITATLTVSDMHGGVVSAATTIAAGASSTGSAVTVGSVTPASNTKPLVSVVASDAFGSEGGDNAAFTVSRVGGSTDTALTVKLAYAGTASRGVDFSALPSDVVIAAGQRSATVAVTVLDDATREAVENLSATVRTNAAYSVSAQNSSAKITLGDNDAPVVSIEAIDAAASESGRDSGTLLITRTGNTVQALTVYYALSGSASNGVDYGRLTGEAVIPAGASATAVVIQALDDERAEATENVTLSLTRFDDAYSVSDSQHAASVAIQDNADLPEISIRTVNNGTEGDSGASFVVHAQGHTPGSVLVHYSVTGTARSGQDFTALQGSILVPTEGAQDVILPVSVLNDTSAESAETVKITLSSSNAYVLGTDKAAEAVIYDNDSGAERVAVSVFQDKPGETDSGTSTGRFYVYRTGTQGDLFVPVSLGGTASAGTDFTVSGLTNGRVLIPNGQKGAVVTFTVADDRVGEGSENVSLTVGTGSGYSVDRNSTASYWITDNDATRITVGFETIGSVIAEQGDAAGTVRDIKVVLSSAASAPISVALQPIEGTATGSNVDWAFLDPSTNRVLDDASTRVTFAAGETEKMVRVRVNADRVLEGGETTTLGLVNPEGASLTTNRGLHTLHIYDTLAQRSSIVETRWAGTSAYDNDRWSDASKIYQGQLSSFTPLNDVGYAFSRQLKGEIVAPTTGEYTFWLAGDDRAKLYLSTDASAANKQLLTRVSWWDDYQSATVTLQAGQRYYLEAQQKDTGDGNRLAVEWQGPSFTRTAVTAPVVSEEDGGNRYIRLLGSGNVLHEDEGRDPHLWVTLDRPAGDAPVSVNVAVSGSAKAGSDYRLGSNVLTFNPGEQTKAIDLSVITDTRGEAPESLRVTLSNANGAILTGPSRYNIVLLDANAPDLSSNLGMVNGRQAQVGDVVTQVTATPVAGHRIVKWEILSGNAERAGNATPAFSIDASGQIKVANVAALPLNSAGMQLTVRATDNTGASNDVNVDVVVNGAAALVQRWSGNAAYDHQDWNAAPTYSANLSGTVAVRDVGDDYSQRIVGTLRPTETGDYRFWIASDDSSRLYLGSDASAASKTLIASMNGWTSFQNWDDGGRSQRIHLEAGKLYYFEAQHQEGGGGDHVSVAWEGPGFARQAIPVSAFVAGLPLDIATPHEELAVSYKAEVAVCSLDTQLGTDTGVAATVRSGGVTRDNTLTLTGQADAGSLVQIFEGRTFLGNATLTGTGWRFTTSALDDGRHTFTAQVVDNTGNIALSNNVSATVRTSKMLDTSANVLLSSANIADNAAQWVGLSGDASHALFGTRNASAFGYRDTRSDSGGAYSDLVWFNMADGTHTLATFGATANTTRGYQVSGVGISADERYVLMQTPWAGDFATFSDSSGSNDVMLYDTVSRSLSLITHQPGSNTRAANADARDVMLSNDGRYVFFSASDASKLGNSSAFRDSAPSSNDVFAYNTASGTLKLMSHAANSNSTSAGVVSSVAGQSQDGRTLYFATNDASAFGLTGGRSTNIIAADVDSGHLSLVSSMGGSYLNRGLVASTDGRYVAYTTRLEKNDTSMGWSINQGGDVVVITDTQTNVTRMVNHSGIEQSSSISYPAWGYNSAKGFTADGRTLVFENNYLGWFNAGFTSSGDSDRALLAYDTETGSLRLLTHAANASNKVQGAGVSYAGMTADGKWALFSANDARQFGNNGTAFTDSNTAAADVFAVQVASGEIRLLSGTNGVSMGSAAQYVGLSADGNTAYFRAADVSALKNAAGMDLVGVRLNVLDLASASDTGNAYDNRTSAHDLTITAMLAPNSSAILRDGNTQLGSATANAEGVATWTLSNVSSGEHRYSLLDGTEQVPIQLVGSVAASVLDVTVI